MNDFRRLLFPICMLLFTSITLTCTISCTEKPGSGETQDSLKKFSEKTLGINIKLPEGTDPKKFIDSVDAYFGFGGTLKNYVSTCPCAPDFLNINYPGLEIEGHETLKTRNSSRPQGLKLPKKAVASRNPIFSSDIIDSSSYTSQNASKWVDYFRTGSYNMVRDSNGKNEKKTSFVKIAVFDTGFSKSLQTLLNNQSIKVKVDEKCYGNSEKSPLRPFGTAYNREIQGLNFAPNGRSRNYLNFNTDDDHENLHGTRVAYLIAREFEKSTKGVQFIFMKVLNKENQGDGFGIICGMFHAQKLGADIFNMSLGYYGREPDTLFKYYLSEFTKKTESNGKKSILVVTAAGNAIKGEGSPEDYSNLPEYRDIDSRTDVKFYPAYFSNELFKMDNVFSATTINDEKNKICEGLNYGKKTVDFGVVATECSFPDLIKNEPAYGTSFAAPVVTGWLGSSVNLGLPKREISKLATKNTPLDNYIRDGRFIIRKQYTQ